MNLTERDKRRTQMFYQLIAILNDQDRAYPQAVHCDTLGVCVLYFNCVGNWDCNWYDYQHVDDVVGVAHETI